MINISIVCAAAAVRATLVQQNQGMMHAGHACCMQACGAAHPTAHVSHAAGAQVRSLLCLHTPALSALQPQPAMLYLKPKAGVPDGCT